MHPMITCWNGQQILKHLRVELNTVSMRVRVSDETVCSMRRLEACITALENLILQLVPLAMLRSFCGLRVPDAATSPLLHSLDVLQHGQSGERVARGAEGARPRVGTAATAANMQSRGCGGGAPIEKFCFLLSKLTRSCLSRCESTIFCRVRLSRQSMRDVGNLAKFTAAEGRLLQPVRPDHALHSDAWHIEYSGRLGHSQTPGLRGQ